jgi:hypothetical protein
MSRAITGASDFNRWGEKSFEKPGVSLYIILQLLPVPPGQLLGSLRYFRGETHPVNTDVKISLLDAHLEADQIVLPDLSAINSGNIHRKSPMYAGVRDIRCNEKTASATS